MVEKLVLHDLSENEFKLDKKKYHIFKASQEVKPCVGCFGCWIKTPGKCLIKDSDSDFALIMPHAEEVIIVSQLVFGGLSPNVKAVFDRSIGFVLPFFYNLNGEMRHKQRYKKRPCQRYMFYSDVISDEEKTTAFEYAKANAHDLGADITSIDFYSSTTELLEALK